MNASTRITKIARRIGLQIDIVKELFEFLVRRKQLWSIPLVLIILFISLFLIFGQATGLAPFIYPLF